MTNGTTNGGVASLWKWVAALLATILLTGAPSIVYALRTWDLKAEVKLLRERQDDVRGRLNTLEAENRSLQAQIIDLHEDLMLHQQNEKGG